MLDEKILSEGNTHSFKFEIAPVAQERARMGRGGRFYIPSKSANFKKEVVSQFIRQWIRQPLDMALYVEITFCFVKPKTVKRQLHTVKPDVDNCTKILLDALNGYLWKDDSQIVGLSAFKRYDTQDGIELNVYEI